MTFQVDLIRHAESLDNCNPYILGGRNASVPLSQLGEQQAAQLGREYTPDSNARLLSSPAVRAVRTGEIAFPSVDLVQDECFYEIYHGEYEGQERASVYTPEEFQRMDLLDWSYRAPGGESWLEVADRMYEGINGYRGEADSLVVISHITTIRALIGRMNGLSQQESFKTLNVPNTSISRVVDHGRGLKAEFTGMPADKI